MIPLVQSSVPLSVLSFVMCQTDKSCTFQNGGTQSYSARETVELVLNEGSDLEDFSDSGSEENIVDSGEEFVPVHLEADSSDSDNNIFIFIIGIHAVATEKGI